MLKKKKKVVPFTWDQLHPQNSKFSEQIEEVESGSSQLILKYMGNTVFIFLFKFLPTTEHADLRGQDRCDPNRVKAMKCTADCTCTNLTQPVIVTLTVHVVPGPTLAKAVHSVLSTRFIVVKIVWLSFLPVEEVYLQMQRLQECYY